MAQMFLQQTSVQDNRQGTQPQRERDGTKVDDLMIDLIILK